MFGFIVYSLFEFLWHFVSRYVNDPASGYMICRDTYFVSYSSPPCSTQSQRQARSSCSSSQYSYTCLLSSLGPSSIRCQSHMGSCQSLMYFVSCAADFSRPSISSWMSVATANSVWRVNFSTLRATPHPLSRTVRSHFVISWRTEAVRTHR